MVKCRDFGRNQLVPLLLSNILLYCIGSDIDRAGMLMDREGNEGTAKR